MIDVMKLAEILGPCMIGTPNIVVYADMLRAYMPLLAYHPKVTGNDARYFHKLTPRQMTDGMRKAGILR